VGTCSSAAHEKLGSRMANRMVNAKKLPENREKHITSPFLSGAILQFKNISKNLYSTGIVRMVRIKS
jgi:hypothetical protein